MKKVLLFATLLATSFAGQAQNKPTTKPKAPTTRPAAVARTKVTPAMNNGTGFNSAIDSVSYAIGINIGMNFKNQGLDNINMSNFIKGLEDAMKNQPPVIDAQKCNNVIQTYFQQMQSKKYEGNKAAGAKFLAENKTKPGVSTTASGLQYSVIKMGDGPKPLATDKVKVHYHGTTIDGQVFDSSVDRGEPISFQLSGLIQGWIEGIPLMPVGSKWKFFLPYTIAYGESGSGPKIPPYSALIFDIELIGIEK